MNKINVGRVLLGGLLAGVVLNIGETLFNVVLFADQMKAFSDRLGLPEPGTNFIIVAVVMTFALGILIVWLYAMIRPRYGPGPKTAVCAALIVWFVGCVYCGILYALILGVPMNLFVIGLAWCLVEYILGAIAGAWLYREDAGHTAAA